MKWSREWVLAIVILATAGVCVHALAPREELPWHRSLADFPLHIDAWHGKELGLDARVLQVLQVDDYLMRQYWREPDQPIGLYVGYYKRMRQGATYHSPKNCLPGSGWYFVEAGTTRLDLLDPNGQAVLINRVVIQKGLEKQLVLYWYQDRGRIITSEYMAKLYMVWDAITKNRTDGTFVRLTIPFSAQQAQAVFAQGKVFAEQILPLLRTYLPG